MSTQGSVIRYRPSAYAATVLPLAGAPRAKIEEALCALIPKDALDGDTLDRLEDASAKEVLALLFAAACVAPDAAEVGLGKLRTLATLPAPAALARLFKAWENDPASIREGELHVSPAPRALLEEIHAARPAAGDGGDSALTQLLDLVASTLADPDASLVYAWEGLHVPTREAAPVPLAWEDAAKQELARAGLPPWDVRLMSALKVPSTPVWIWQIEHRGERVAHVTVDDDGTMIHLVREVPSFWRRLFQTHPPSHRLVPGPCPDPACRLCRAATQISAVILGKA